MDEVALLNVIHSLNWSYLYSNRDEEDGMVACAVVDVDDSINRVDYYYCHAGLWHSYDRKPTSRYIVTATKEFLAFEEAATTYYDWLFHRSIFKDVFVSPDSFLKKRFIVTRTDVEADILMSALIASRLPWENYFSSRLYNSCNAFHHYVKLGMDEDAAFILGYETYDVKSMKFRVTDHGHEAIQLSHRPTFNNFVKRQFTLGKYGLYRDGGSTRPFTNHLWNKDGHYDNLDELINLIKDNDIAAINKIVGELRGNA